MKTYTTHTLYLDDHPIVRKHCDHDRSASWRIVLQNDSDSVAYLQGTPAQLIAFAEALQHAAGGELLARKQDAEAEIVHPV